MSGIPRITAEHYHASREDVTGRIDLTITGAEGAVVIDLGDDGDEILAGLLGFSERDEDEPFCTDDASGRAALSDITPEKIAHLKRLLASIGDLPWFLSDCEGEVEIWRESALRISRDEHGEIVGYSMPGSYARNDLVAEWGLDTWDEGQDEDDDERRRMAELIVEAVNALPFLIAAAEGEGPVVVASQEFLAAARALYRWHTAASALDAEQFAALVYDVDDALAALTPEQVAVLAGDDEQAAQADKDGQR